MALACCRRAERRSRHVFPAESSRREPAERVRKRGCLFKIFSAISFCLGVPFFTFSARYSAMALLVASSFSASPRRSVVAMYIM